MASKRPRPTLVSLFTGAGGLDIGLENAGFETIFANEIEPYACESLRANKVLRSLRIDQFEEWFKQQISEQRCYLSAPLPKLARLKRRLKGAIGEPVHYLTHAHIEERDVRDLSASFILKTTGKRVGEIDLVAGGPPCQPFSRAGKRELVDCDTGQLFRDFVRIVLEIRPRFFLFENVKGLVIHKADVASLFCRKCMKSALVPFEQREGLKQAKSTVRKCAMCGHTGKLSVIWDKRRAGSLEIIEQEFIRAGYKCQSVVLNAADFGAAQARERLFIVGSRDGESFDWPEGNYAPISTKKKAPSLPGVLEPRKAPWRTMKQVLYSKEHWRYGKLDPRNGVLWVKNVVRPHDEPVTWSLDRVAPTIGAHQAAKLAIAPKGVPDAQLKRQQWHTLGRRQGDTKPVFVEHEYLTDEELLRLQTFPASWYLYGTRMQRAFQIGNAVPPILAEAVGAAIMQAIINNTSVQKRARIPNEKRYAARF